MNQRYEDIRHVNERHGRILVYREGLRWQAEDLTDAFAGGAITAAMIANRTRNLWIGAEDFTIWSGTPALAIQGGNSRYRAWALDAGTTEGVLAECIMPEDYVSAVVTCKIYWTNLGAGSGNVVLNLTLANRVDTEDLDGTASNVNDDDTVAAPGQHILDIYSHGAAFTPVAGELIVVIVQRKGGDAGDTLANDAGLIGVEIEYTADS